MKCKRCGRALKTASSQRLGIGPVCERAEISEAQSDLFAPRPVDVSRLLPGVPEGIGSRIADLVGLLRQADLRLSDPRFSRRLSKVLGEKR